MKFSFKFFDNYSPAHPAAEAMEFLVKRILELSSKEVEEPTDVVDLGGEDGYEISELVGGSNGYAKTSKLNGLSAVEPSLESKPRCCN